MHNQFSHSETENFHQICSLYRNVLDSLIHFIDDLTSNLQFMKNSKRWKNTSESKHPSNKKRLAFLRLMEWYSCDEYTKKKQKKTTSSWLTRVVTTDVVSVASESSAGCGRNWWTDAIGGWSPHRRRRSQSACPGRRSRRPRPIREATPAGHAPFRVDRRPRPLTLPSPPHTTSSSAGDRCVNAPPLSSFFGRNQPTVAGPSRVLLRSSFLVNIIHCTSSSSA